MGHLHVELATSADFSVCDVIVAGTLTAKEGTPLLGQSTMVEEIKVDMPGAPKPIKKASSMVSAKGSCVWHISGG